MGSNCCKAQGLDESVEDRLNLNMYIYIYVFFQQANQKRDALDVLEVRSNDIHVFQFLMA